MDEWITRLTNVIMCKECLPTTTPDIFERAWKSRRDEIAGEIEHHYRAATPTDKMRELNEECAILRKDCIRMGQAILWALGEHEEFPAREEGQGAYWWRGELRRRSGLRAWHATKAETCPTCGSGTRDIKWRPYRDIPDECRDPWHATKAETCPTCLSERKEYRRCAVMPNMHHNAETLVTYAHACKDCTDPWHSPAPAPQKEQK